MNETRRETSTDHGIDDGAALTDLANRLRRLEDIESIRVLKARYCERCDADYDPDGLAALFTEDAVWDGGNTFGVAHGREAIRRHFQGASSRVAIARHQVMNPIIDVDGDTATGHWLLFQPCTNAGVDAHGERADDAVWLAATYADTYRREEGRWLISNTTIDVAFFTSFEVGWGQQRFLPGREPAGRP